MLFKSLSSNVHVGAENYLKNSEINLSSQALSGAMPPIVVSMPFDPKLKKKKKKRKLIQF